MYMYMCMYMYMYMYMYMDMDMYMYAHIYILLRLRIPSATVSAAVAARPPRDCGARAVVAQVRRVPDGDGRHAAGLRAVRDGVRPPRLIGALPNRD